MKTAKATTLVREAEMVEADALARLVELELSEEIDLHPSVYSANEDIAKQACGIALMYFSQIGRAWLAFVDDELVGYCGLMRLPSFGNRMNVVTATGYYVKPSHRGSSLALCLWRAAEKWAKSEGIDYVQGVYSNLGDGGSRVLLGRGGAEVGHVVQMKLLET